MALKEIIDAGKTIGKAVSTVATAAGKAVSKHPKVATRAYGAKQAISGARAIADGIKRGDSGKVLLNVPKTVLGTALTLFNHPEWYTQGGGDANLVGANFGLVQQVKPIRTDTGDISSNNINYPGHCVYPIYLSIPNDNASSFIQAIAGLYAQIRAANSGSINYDMYDLMAYVLNVRLIRAMCIQAQRTIQSYYTMDPYIGDSPKLFTRLSTDCGLSNGTQEYRGAIFELDSRRATDDYNRLNLLMSEVRNRLPLNLHLFDRTHWLLSNMFRDSNDRKCSYHSFVLHQNQIRFEVDRTGSTPSLKSTVYSVSPITTANGERGVDKSLSQIQGLLNYLTIGTAVNIVIAGDIIKTFGDGSFYNISLLPLGTPIPLVYDEAALTQIQNMSYLASYRGHTNFSDTQTFTQSVDSGGLMSTKATASLIEGAGMDSFTSTDSVLPNFRLMKKGFLNFYKDTVSGPELLSAIRLKFTMREVSVKDNTKSYNFGACGTEIVSAMHIIYNRINDWNLDNVNFTRFLIVPLAIPNSPAMSIGTAQYIAQGWSSVDYAPLTLVGGDTSGQNTASFTAMWDWNNFAMLDVTQQSYLLGFGSKSLFIPTSPMVSPRADFHFVNSSDTLLVDHKSSDNRKKGGRKRR